MGTNDVRNWEALFLEQERSGESVSVFCSTRGINYHSFKNRKTHWNNKRVRQSSSANSFIEVVPESKALLRVVLKNGRTLEVPSTFEEANIRRLLGILESC